MQYVEKVGGYVYNQWKELNPATLSGAIDVIVIEQPDGTLHCSPWHVRFGKFQIIKPSQKKVDLYVNDIKTDLPMKLGEGGEAFFVFETDDENQLLSKSVLTSPVISPASSPGASPSGSPRNSVVFLADNSPQSSTLDLNKSEPDELDLNSDGITALADDIENKIKLQGSPPSRPLSKSSSSDHALKSKIAFEQARKITQKLNIPSKIDINGDMVLDMDGYKPNSQKNIDSSDELFKKIFLKEITEINDSEEHEISGLDQIISKDENGNIRILNKSPDHGSAMEDDLDNIETSTPFSDVSDNESEQTRTTTSINDKTYFKTLRLTSEQLQKMNLKYGENRLTFKLSQGTAHIVSYLYLWKSSTPLVISDIDGTITKSDALGHVLNLFGKDWTHEGVAKLFQDIKSNSYNIVYLTARSVGQSDSTRQYLRGIIQDGTMRLPKGPVILSPDRTIAALKREVILKKPEVFKMACLNDIRSLYLGGEGDDEDKTPFYAGFGNRITDAISYRSVKIPSHRIFTINPNGEVHMELLELAGYKSSYLHIGELVDHFFPPIREVSTLSTNWNDNQFNEYMSHAQNSQIPGSPGSPRSPRSIADDDIMTTIQTDEKFNDVNYWREPLNLSDLSSIEDEYDEPIEEPKSPSLLSIRSFGSTDGTHESNNRKSNAVSQDHSPERAPSSSSFASPLKSFMTFGSANNSNKKGNTDNSGSTGNLSLQNNNTKNDKGEAKPLIIRESEDNLDDDSDYTDDPDYTDDEDDYDEDDYDDDEDVDEDDVDEDDVDYSDYDIDVDNDDIDMDRAETLDHGDDIDEDLDLDDGLPKSDQDQDTSKNKPNSHDQQFLPPTIENPSTQLRDPLESDGSHIGFKKASEFGT